MSARGTPARVQWHVLRQPWHVRDERSRTRSYLCQRRVLCERRTLLSFARRKGTHNRRVLQGARNVRGNRRPRWNRHRQVPSDPTAPLNPEWPRSALVKPCDSILRLPSIRLCSRKGCGGPGQQDQTGRPREGIEGPGTNPGPRLTMRRRAGATRAAALLRAGTGSCTGRSTRRAAPAARYGCRARRSRRP